MLQQKFFTKKLFTQQRTTLDAIGKEYLMLSKPSMQKQYLNSKFVNRAKNADFALDCVNIKTTAGTTIEQTCHF